jgi:hypothetical protein
MSGGGALLPAPTGYRWLWTGTALLAFVASTIGALDPVLYDRLLPASLLPGAFGQDVTTILAALGLLALAALDVGRTRNQLVALGLLGYLFYAYGVLVIERVYNELYLGYLAVFALATWTLVSAAVTIGRTRPAVAAPPAWARVTIVAGAALQPLVFIPLWISALLPLIAERRQIDSLYSIYILDLAVIMPAFLIAAVLCLLRRPAGLLLASVLFVLGAVLMLSLLASALAGPLFDAGVSVQAVLPPLLLTALFTGLAVLSLRFAGRRTAESSDLGRPTLRDAVASPR